jgi:hypothetical protein
MAKHWSVQDFDKIPVINLRLENLGSAPTLTSSDAGYAYYDTVLGYARFWTGTAWVSVTNLPATGSVTSAMIADGTIVDGDINSAAGIAMSKLAVDPTLRSNHSGTQLAATISDFNSAVRLNRLDQLAAPTAAVAMNGQKLTGLADPTSAQDAATKNYVDAVSAGFNVQASVRVATTAAITLSGTQTIDGVAVVAGDRVLVKNGSTTNAGTSSIDNGIYVVAAGAWSRATDQSQGSAGGSNGIQLGDFVFIESGTATGASAWIVTTSGTITLGTTPITWAQVGSATTYTGTTNRTTVSGNVIDISSSYVGQTSITTVGTIGTGVWNGTAVDIAHGGTGATTAAAARTALGAVGKFAATLATSATSYAVSHNLGTTDVSVSIKEVATSALAEADVVVTDANTVTISFASAPAANAFRVTVIG